MEHVKALLMKFALTTAVLFVVLSLFYGVDFGDVLLLSLILTGVAYLGDLYVLPNTSNTVASLADIGLAFFIIWLVGGGVIEENIPLVMASLISAIVIGICEAFFHRYMEGNVLNEEHDRGPRQVSQTQFSTEFGSDQADDLKTDDVDPTQNDDNNK